MSECVLIQHLKRIIGIDPELKNIAGPLLAIVHDIRESKISGSNINYLVDLLPAIYELDDTDLLRRHLETGKPDCLICAAVETRLASGTSLATA